MSTETLLTVDDYAQLPAVPATVRHHYGADAEQFGDLYLPAAPPKDDAGYPLIVLIHGGCWGAQYGLTQLGQFCHHFAEQGNAVWNLEYRRIGNGGGWPNTFLDVATGTDSLRTIAAEHALDLHRTVAVGHSAGGHLALWLAARAQIDPHSPLYSANPLPLTGVVALAGIPDLVDAEANNICRGAVPALLGGTATEEPERYRAGSPSAHLPLGVRQTLIIGTDDRAVPVQHNARYCDAARAAGDDVTLTVLEQTGHFEIVIPGTNVWPVVERTILATLNHAVNSQPSN